MTNRRKGGFSTSLRRINRYSHAHAPITAIGKTISMSTVEIVFMPRKTTNATTLEFNPKPKNLEGARIRYGTILLDWKSNDERNCPTVWSAPAWRRFVLPSTRTNFTVDQLVPPRKSGD
jgi:hypothetical protein